MLDIIDLESFVKQAQKWIEESNEFTISKIVTSNMDEYIPLTVPAQSWFQRLRDYFNLNRGIE